MYIWTSDWPLTLFRSLNVTYCQPNLFDRATADHLAQSQIAFWKYENMKMCS